MLESPDSRNNLEKQLAYKVNPILANYRSNDDASRNGLLQQLKVQETPKQDFLNQSQNKPNYENSRQSRECQSVDKHNTNSMMCQASLKKDLKVTPSDNKYTFLSQNSQSDLMSPRLVGGTTLSIVQQLSSNRRAGGSHFKDMQKEVYQHKCQLLEDKLYKTQIELRKKEGCYVKQIAVLQQQVTQIQFQLEEAIQRETKQKFMYQRILRLIKEQFESSNTDSEAFLQTIINEANKGIAISPIKQRPTNFKRESSSILSIGNIVRQGPAFSTNKEIFAPASDLKTNDFEKLKKEHSEALQQMENKFKEQIQILNKNKDELTKQTGNHATKLQNLQDKNDCLTQQVEKLEQTKEDQKSRETKLKDLHDEEQKFINEMHETQNQLNQSKINGLQATIVHLQSKIRRCSGNEDRLSQLDDASQLEIGGALTQAGANLGGSTSRMHSTALKKERERRKSQNLAVQTSFRNDKSVEYSPLNVTVQNKIKHSFVATPNAHNIQMQNQKLKEELSKLKQEHQQEVQTWEQKKQDFEQTVQKLKKIINFNLNNHKDATDRLRVQLKEAETKNTQKNQENKLLQKKLTIIKLQISKLEKVQAKEMSRSRSSFKLEFGRGRDTSKEVLDKIESTGILKAYRSHDETSINLNLRTQAKNKLYGEYHMQKSLRQLRLKKNAEKYQSQRSQENSRHLSINNLDDVNPKRIDSFRSTGLESKKDKHTKQNGHLVSPITSISVANQNQKKNNANMRYSSNKNLQNFDGQDKKNHLSNISSLDSVNKKSSIERACQNTNRSRSRRLRQYMQTIANRKNIQNFKETQGQINFNNQAVQSKTQTTSFVDIMNKRKQTKTFLQTNRYESQNKRNNNELYHSIQCNGSPENFKLQPVSRIITTESEDKNKYLGNVTNQKKLISNLLNENSFNNGSRLNSNAKHMTKENALQMKFDGKSPFGIKDDLNDINLRQRHQNDVEVTSSMNISPVKQEAVKAKINDNLKDFGSLTDRNGDDYCIEPVVMEFAESSQASKYNSNQEELKDHSIIRERDLFMSQVYKQHQLLNNQNALSIVQQSSPQVSRQFTFKYQDPSLMPKQNSQDNLNQQVISKLEDLYSRLIKQDSQNNNQLGQTVQMKDLINQLTSHNNELIVKLDEYQEQKQELILAYKKLEFRQKQAQIILNDQHMKNDFNLEVTNQRDNNASQGYALTMTAQQRSLYSDHSPQIINQIPNTTETDSNLRKSIENLNYKGSQIKQLENIMSIQRLLSVRSRDGSNQSKSNHMRSFNRDDQSIHKNGRAYTQEDDQLKFTFQCQKPVDLDLKPDNVKSINKKESFKVPQKFLQNMLPSTVKNSQAVSNNSNNFFIPRIDISKTDNFRNTNTAVDFTPKIVEKVNTSNKNRSQPKVDVDQAQHSARNTNIFVKGSAGILGKQSKTSTGIAATARSPRQQIKYVPSNTRTALALGKQTKSLRSGGYTGQTASSKLKRNITSQVSQGVDKKHPTKLNQDTTSSRLQFTQRSPTLQMDIVKEAHQTELRNQNNHNDLNQLTSPPKSMLENYHTMYQNDGNRIINNSVQSIHSQKSIPEVQQQHKTEKLTKKHKISRNNDLMCKSKETKQQAATYNYLDMDAEGFQASYFNIANISQDISSIDQSQITQVTPVNTAKANNETNFTMNQTKLGTTIHNKNKSEIRYDDSDPQVQCFVNTTYVPTPTYQNQVQPSNKLNESTKQPVSILQAATQIKNLNMHQPLNTTLTRRKSEESDENLVNLFGSENTPQNVERKAHYRAISASANVIITNEDSQKSSSQNYDNIQMALSKNVQNLIDKRMRQQQYEKPDVTPEKLQQVYYADQQVNRLPFPPSSLVTVNENENQDSASEHSQAICKQKNVNIPDHLMGQYYHQQYVSARQVHPNKKNKINNQQIQMQFYHPRI